MYTPRNFPIYAREESDGPGLSRQNIIIIAVCSGVAAVVLGYFLYRSIRNCCQYVDPAPLPPVQPLAHHRELHVARVEESIASRPQTWYQPNHPATHSVGSKASLLGKSESPLTSPQSASTHQHLPLPSPSYRNPRPGSSSSTVTSSDASCTSPHSAPLSVESAAPPLPRPITELRSGNPPFRRHRPLSMSSTGSHNTAASRTSRHTLRSVPHAAHSQVQIILPTPLASLNNSRESLSLSIRRRQSGSYDRRSVADSWLLIESSANCTHPFYSVFLLSN